MKTLMRILGYRNADLERKLGWSVSYLSRLYSGGIELRFEHIVDIARAIGLEPQELFELVYTQPRRPPTEAAQRIRETFGPAQPPEPPVPASRVELPRDEESLEAVEQGMERMMMKMLRKLFAEMMAKGAVGE
ncbi:MAG: helix-turn-helix domain-containing protein [Thermoanaerobaculia bacterium]